MSGLILPNRTANQNSSVAYGQQYAKEALANNPTNLNASKQWYYAELQNYQALLQNPSTDPQTLQEAANRLRDAALELAAANEFLTLNNQGHLFDLPSYLTAEDIDQLQNNPNYDPVNNTTSASGASTWVHQANSMLTNSPSQAGSTTSTPPIQPPSATQTIGTGGPTANLPNGMPPAQPYGPFPSISAAANSLQTTALQVKQPPSDYTHLGIVENKAIINQALDEENATEEERACLLAIAMLESCSLGENSDPACYSIFNFNKEMIEDLNRRYGLNMSAESMRGPEATHEATKVMLLALRTYGAEGLMAFHRGGITGWNHYQQGGLAAVRPGAAAYGADPNSWYQTYFNDYAAVYNAIIQDPSILRNGIRPETLR